MIAKIDNAKGNLVRVRLNSGHCYCLWSLLFYPRLYNLGHTKMTKQISILLTKILTVIKEGLETYSDTAFSRNGINQMWILKKSKTLLDNSSQDL